MNALKPAWDDIAVGSKIGFESSLLNRFVEQTVVKKTVEGKMRRLHTDTLVVEYDRKDLELIMS